MAVEGLQLSQRLDVKSEHRHSLVPVQIREYEDGALAREEPITEEQLEVVLGKRAAPVKRRQRRARAKVRAPDRRDGFVAPHLPCTAQRCAGAKVRGPNNCDSFMAPGLRAVSCP